MSPPGVVPHRKFPGIFWATQGGERRLATRSLAPGRLVYGEEVIKAGDEEYRVWNHFRSKLAAGILKGLSDLPIRPRVRVLYLGAGSGTTVSHVSDILGDRGLVYCVEFAQRSLRDLVNNVAAYRRNITPILEDARFPEKYRSIVTNVDCIYCDIAQPDQARILADNLDSFSEEPGDFLMAVKARSIDVTKDPSIVFQQERRVLEERGYKVLDMIRLEPFEMDHCMIRGRG